MIGFPKPIKKELPKYPKLTPSERKSKIKEYRFKQKEKMVARKAKNRFDRENKVSTLKKKAWNLCSIYVRMRDCKATTGTFERGVCFTCSVVVEYKSGQAGHFIPGRGGVVLFDVRQIHLQCFRCNINLKGNWVPYRLKMVDKYGEEEVKRLELDSRGIKHWKAFELHEKIEEFTRMIWTIKSS